ncbi:MAG: ComEC/Rec2 family competence protein [Lentisphaeria bacterium]|nr:ComEC/Rec2 family competence protein [Lentisphaeria bacterium]
MKKFLNRIHFEYLLLAFVVPTAALMAELHEIYMLAPFVLLSVLFAWRVNFCKGVFCLAALLLLWLFNGDFAEKKENKLAEILNHRPIYGKVQFEISDPLVCSLPHIRNGATAEVKIINIRTLGGETFAGGGKFLVFAKNILPASAAFGDIFEVEGTLKFTNAQAVWNFDTETLEHDFKFGDFQHYMRMREIAGIIYPDKNTEVRKIGQNNSFSRKFLLFRDKMLGYALKDMQTDNANLAAALFAGLKGALQMSEKQAFIKSGTIHLFSVSGLHIGILFSLLLLLTFFLPPTARYISASLLLIPFLLSTGANVPAMRAFLMILVYSLLRCFCFHIPTLRVLAGGCAVFLIYEIDYLSDAGFLYSFGITGILLLAAEKIRIWNRIWNTDNKLGSTKHKKYLLPRQFSVSGKKIIFALCSTLGAFAGGSIITLTAFGYLYLSQVWINFFILFYSTLLLGVFVLKLIFTPIVFIGAFCGKLMDICFDFMQEVIGFGANYPLQLDTVQVPLILAIVFYFALLFMGTVRNKAVFTVSFVVLAAFFPCGVLLARLQKPQVMLIRTPADNQTAFVLADRRANYAWAYNIQNSQSAEIARKFLASKGINHLNLWIQYGSSKNKLNAFSSAASNLRIKQIIHISRKADENMMQGKGTIYNFRRAKGTNIDFRQGVSRFFRKKNQFGFEYFNHGVILPLSAVCDTETQILKFRSGGKEKIEHWTNSNITEYFIYDI